MRKTYGGFLGAKKAHERKIKMIKLFTVAVALFFACATVFSMENASIGAKVSTGLTTAGIMVGGVMVENPTEEQKLIHQIETTVKQINKEGGDATKAELKILKDKLEELSKKEALPAEVKAAIAELQAEVKALKEVAAVVPAKSYATIKEALFAAFEEKKDLLKLAATRGQKETLAIEIKAAVTMSDENTIGSGSTQVTLTDNTGKIVPIRKRTEAYFAAVSVGSMTGNRALWIEESDAQGTPIMLGEGDGKTQLSSIWTEKTSDVKKIAVYGKVTTELLSDLPQLVSFIQNSILRRMEVALEDQLFNGDGIGDNLKGAIEYATAYASGDLAGTVTDANEYDVIEAVANQVLLAFGIPNAIFLNPTDIAKMKMLKASGDGQYLYPLFATTNGMEIAGMKVIATPAIAAGTFLGGDMTVIQVLNREILSLQIGLDGNDFTQNKKTMLAERRLAQFVPANDATVLITGTFAAAKAELQTA